MRCNEHRCNEKKKQLSENFVEILGVFSNGILGIIECNSVFIIIVQNQYEGKLLNNDIIPEIK